MIIVALVIICLIVIAIYEFRTSVINLDANATTSPHPQVISAMSAAATLGNPSAYWASDASSIVDRLKCKLLAICGKPAKDFECIITSGCSESNNLLFRGFCGPIYISGFEHKTSIECVQELGETIVHGWPHPQQFVVEAGALVSVMAVNNETGDIFDIETISRECRDRGTYFHSDISQFLGKMTDSSVLRYCDAISGSAHKLHGPQGVGFLIINRALNVRCQISGTQNAGLRGGTYNVAGCAGFDVALDITLANRQCKNEKLQRLCQNLWTGIQLLNKKPIKITKSSYNTLLVSLPTCNLQLREYLTKRGVQVSIGSACNVSKKEASHILHELKLPREVRSGVIRFSVSDYNTDHDIARTLQILQDYFSQ